MKRKSKQNVGQYPNMRDDTLKFVAGELVRARKRYPQKSRNLEALENQVSELRKDFRDHTAKNSTASQIYARCAAVAAMAIRCLEEGTGGQAYMGNIKVAPDFKLTGDDE